MSEEDPRITRARAAHPRVTAPPETFLAWLAERDAPGVSLHVEDIYLACACAAGDPNALAVFAEMLAPELAALRSRHGYLPADAEDFLQLACEKLFVGPEPKIREYAGRGELRTWVRVMLSRMFLNAATRDTRERPAGEEIFLALPTVSDPEAEALRARHGEALRVAFVDAVGRLSTRDRNMLRYVIVEGLGVDAIAKIYAVHRATAARRVADAKDALGVELRAALQRALGVGDSTLESVLRSMQTRIDVSVSEYFGRRG